MTREVTVCIKQKYTATSMGMGFLREGSCEDQGVKQIFSFSKSLIQTYKTEPFKMVVECVEARQGTFICTAHFIFHTRRQLKVLYGIKTSEHEQGKTAYVPTPHPHPHQDTMFKILRTISQNHLIKSNRK